MKKNNLLLTIFILNIVYTVISTICLFIVLIFTPYGFTLWLLGGILLLNIALSVSLLWLTNENIIEGKRGQYIAIMVISIILLIVSFYLWFIALAILILMIINHAINFKRLK